MGGKDAAFIFGNTEKKIRAQLMPSQPAISGYNSNKAIRTPRNVLRRDCDGPRQTFHINFRQRESLPLGANWQRGLKLSQNFLGRDGGKADTSG